MRALVQRVTDARVTVRRDPTDGPAIDPEDRVEVGRIGPGLVVLLGVTHDDDAALARRMADKLWHLRVFADDHGAMNRSCADVGGELLVVSQFTLYGDARKGRRPSFVAAARPDHAQPLVDEVVAALRSSGATVATGSFRTDMQVALVNDGPVTLLVEL